jgi:hypothetical protein
VPAPDIDTVKDFLLFYVATSKGKLDKRSTIDLVNTHTEWFFAGFSRVIGTLTDKEERSEVYHVCVFYKQVEALKLISLLNSGLGER